MDYDPTSNPRSLIAPEPPQEHVAKYQDKWDKLQRELDNLSAQIGMFRSRAWLSLQPEWEMQRQDALNAVADTRRVNSMEKLANIQGQVAVLDRLLNMPSIAKNRQKVILAEMKQLRRDAGQFLDNDS